MVHEKNSRVSLCVRVSPYMLVTLIFYFVLILVGLVNSCSSEVSEKHGFPRTCLATLSLETVEDVMGGEVDELEEDVG